MVSRDADADWLLPFLGVIQARPGMYLGDESVRTLATYISGYTQAREDLGVERYGRNERSLLAEFELWLKNELRTQKDLNWEGCILEVDQTDRSAHTFFKLFRKFLNQMGRSMPEPEQASLLWPTHKPFQ